MQRILDLDLDFFLNDVAVFRSFDSDRLDSEDYTPWPMPDVLSFLEGQCLLTGQLPGCAVEHHGEVFGRWRDAIDNGLVTEPFRVAHVDAHADLGLGEGNYVYLLTELLWEPMERRRFPVEGSGGMTDGSYLAFAAACRWLAEIDYVYCPGGGDDLHPYLMEGFDPHAERLQLARLTKEELKRLQSLPQPRPPIPPARLEPPVPLRRWKASEFQVEEPFDMIYLSRSPAFTPAASDAVYEEIRRRFIDEGTLT